jgi:hypothetical protein
MGNIQALGLQMPSGALENDPELAFAASKNVVRSRSLRHLAEQGIPTVTASTRGLAACRQCPVLYPRSVSCSRNTKLP